MLRCHSLNRPFDVFELWDADSHALSGRVGMEPRQLYGIYWVERRLAASTMASKVVIDTCHICILTHLGAAILTTSPPDSSYSGSTTW